MGKQKDEEEKKDRAALLLQERKKIIYNLVLVVTASFVVLIGMLTMAWFTVNQDVNGGGWSITTRGTPYEIEVHGSYVENESDFEKLNIFLSSKYGTDAVYEYGEQPDENYQYFSSTALKDKIIWRKEAQTEEKGHYVDGLEPNSCGELKFWVVAKEAGIYNPTFVFSIKGYHAITHNVTQNGAIVEIVDEIVEINNSLSDYVTSDASLTAENIQQKIDALEYIRGHILFFRNRDNDGYYSGFLGTARSFDLSDVYTDADGTTFTEGEKKVVTIYWKWANTFEQMIYDSNYASYAPILKNVSSNDRTALYSYMQPNNNSMFFGMTNSEISSNLSIVQNNGDGFSAAVTRLSNAYNDADQEIGDKVDYILIEMKTEN